MKKPDYALCKEVSIHPKDQNGGDPVVFGSGTLVFPFWNETFLPSHIRKDLEEAKKDARRGMDGFLKPKKEETRLIMCMIGRHWIVIPISYIKQV